MPFRSRAQMRYLFAKHPAIAKRWAREYGTPKGLPARKTSMRDVLTRHKRRKVIKKKR